MSESSMPPLNVTGDSAECPICGQECYHPLRIDMSDELVMLTDIWECFECDYEYYESD